MRNIAVHLLLLSLSLTSEHCNGLFSRGFLGWTNFASVINNVKDIFSMVTDGNYGQTSLITLPEDSHLNVKQIVIKYGYHFEEHNVTTKDGYILTLHRVRDERNRTKNKTVVFLMHGLIDSSDSWILQGPNRALGFVLAERGFDVWMGNARGNKHSFQHVNLTNKDSQFWRFTWEEIGLYDLPAMLNYALNFTGTRSLFYVGHSQGTTSFYVLASMKPEFREKIKLMFSLSPVAYMSHIKSPIVRMFSPANKALAFLMSNFNTYSPSTDFLNRIMSVICFLAPRCDNLWSMIVGDTSAHINKTLLPIVFAHMPSGSSTLQFVHYGQLVESGDFCRYDFGVLNLKIYGQERPPKYNLTQIEIPTVLFYGGKDWLSDPLDVDLLKSQLRNVSKAYYIDDYNHWDFMYAADANDVIYEKIVKHIENFQ